MGRGSEFIDIKLQNVSSLPPVATMRPPVYSSAPSNISISSIKYKQYLTFNNAESHKAVANVSELYENFHRDWRVFCVAVCNATLSEYRLLLKTQVSLTLAHLLIISSFYDITVALRKFSLKKKSLY